MVKCRIVCYLLQMILIISKFHKSVPNQSGVHKSVRTSNLLHQYKTSLSSSNFNRNKFFLTFNDKQKSKYPEWQNAWNNISHLHLHVPVHANSCKLQLKSILSVFSQSRTNFHKKDTWLISWAKPTQLFYLTQRNFELDQPVEFSIALAALIMYFY